MRPMTSIGADLRALGKEIGWQSARQSMAGLLPIIRMNGGLRQQSSRSMAPFDLIDSPNAPSVATTFEDQSARDA